MMTRSIVGRFLILAVLLVSLLVIGQAALVISRQSGKAVAKSDPGSPVRLAAAAPAADPATASMPAAAAPAAPAAPVAASTPAAAAAPVAAAASVAAPASVATTAPQSGDAAPIRVVYPGPLGDAPVMRKVADAAPASPAAPTPAPQLAAPTPAPQPVAAAVAPPAPAPSAPAAKPAAAVVASAEADAEPTTPAAPAAGKGGINLNSASVAELNGLGGGHIGQAIVKHRPYHSVDDLVKKRVVRRSVFDQIKNEVAAD